MRFVRAYAAGRAGRCPGGRRVGAPAASDGARVSASDPVESALSLGESYLRAGAARVGENMAGRAWRSR